MPAFQRDLAPIRGKPESRDLLRGEMRELQRGRAIERLLRKIIDALFSHHIYDGFRVWSEGQGRGRSLVQFMIVSLLVLDRVNSKDQPVIQLTHSSAHDPLSVRRYAPPERSVLDQGFRLPAFEGNPLNGLIVDRKSTRLNSSHLGISYAVF